MVTKLPGGQVSRAAAIGEIQAYGNADPTADMDPKTHFLFAPQSGEDYLRYAAHYLPQDLQYPQDYINKTRAFHTMLREAQQGSKQAKSALVEAISYNDFKYVMADTIYREMLKGYEIPDSPMDLISVKKTVPTPNRPAKLFMMDGITKPLDILYEGEVPKARSPYDSGIGYTVNKFGADVYLLWETLIEDDLGALNDIPGMLTQAFKATKGRMNTALYAKDGGFWDDADKGPFDTANNDKVLNPDRSTTSRHGIDTTLRANDTFGVKENSKLDLPALQAARTQIRKRTTPDGNPIDTTLTHLVVGVGQAERAKMLLAASGFVTERMGGNQGTAGDANAGFVRMQLADNPAAGFQLHVDPYLHLVNTNSNADTMWMLIADPTASRRPAFITAHLKGYEKPIMQREVPRFQPAGVAHAGYADWISTGYRIMMIYGAAWGDMRPVIGSLGTG